MIPENRIHRVHRARRLALGLLALLPVLAPAAPAQESPDEAGASPHPGVSDLKYAAMGLPREIVRFIRLPGGGHHPRVVRDEAELLHVVFFRPSVPGEAETPGDNGRAEGDEPARGDLFHTTSADDGTTFAEPIRVNARPGTVDLGRGSNGPRVAWCGGALHVVWTAAVGSEGRRSVVYARRPRGAASFEPGRDLSGDVADVGLGAAIAADLVHEDARLYVLFTAGEGGEGAGVADAHVYLATSADGGDTFAAPRVADDGTRGVSVESALDAIVANTGKLFCLYRAKEGKRRDMRLLVSRDRGDSFEDSAVQFTARRRDPQSGASLTLGGHDRVLIAWEEPGDVLWSFYLGAKDSVALPIAPKTRPQRYRRNPTVLTNSSIAALMTWIEKDRGAEDDTFQLGWQAWDITLRRPIGRGLAPELSGGSTPAIFVRSDDGFAILY